MAEPSEWAKQVAADFLWPRYYANEEGNETTKDELIADDASCWVLALTLDAARRKGEADERERCVAILHDEGWLGQSEQRIAHPNLFTKELT